MTTPTFHDRAKMTVASAPGTGNITLGSAVPGAQTFAAAGVANGETISYVVEDGTAWEYGKATYTASGTTLARTPTKTSAGNATALSLSANAVVYITALAEDLALLAAGASIQGVLEKPFVAPPALSTFTQQNFDPNNTQVATITAPAAGIQLNEVSHNYGNSNYLRALLVATPSAHYDLKVRVRRHAPLVQYAGWGIVMRDNVGGASMIIGQTAADNGWGAIQLKTDTTYNTDFGLGGFRTGDYHYDLWLRIVNDGTNFRFYTSKDGVYWTQLTYYNDSTINGFFANAPDQIGFGYSVNNSDNGLVASDITCFSWELAALS